MYPKKRTLKRRYGEDHRGNDRRGGGSYRKNGGGGQGVGGGGDCGDRRSYNRSQSCSGPPQSNSRWNNVESVGDGGGGRGGYNNDRRSSYGGGGRRNEARINERGFHGDMRPDKRLEKQLFAGEERQTTGINFDNYDKIHVESAGNDIPEPIDVYTEESIGWIFGCCGQRRRTRQTNRQQNNNEQQKQLRQLSRRMMMS